MAGISGDGFAVALEGEAGGQFVGDQLIVGGALERQEGLQELPDLGRPVGVMVAAGEVGRAKAVGCCSQAARRRKR